MSDRRVQLWCVYACYVFVALFLVSWVILAGFVPPPSPADRPQEISDFYLENTTGIRIGMVISVFSAALLLPWGGAVAAQMQRVEARRSPLLWGFIAAQATVVMLFVFPCVFWLVAAFRPENAERVQTFNDLAWLSFLGVVCTGMFQMIALAVVTLRDRRPDPVFPRWFAYFQLWCFVGVPAGGGTFFFKTGPLAWDGVLGFWLPVSVYFSWVMVISAVTARAIKRDDEIPAGAELDVRERVEVLESRLALLEPRTSRDGTT